MASFLPRWLWFCPRLDYEIVVLPEGQERFRATNMPPYIIETPTPLAVKLQWVYYVCDVMKTTLTSWGIMRGTYNLTLALFKATFTGFSSLEGLEGLFHYQRMYEYGLNMLINNKVLASGYVFVCMLRILVALLLRREQLRSKAYCRFLAEYDSCKEPRDFSELENSYGFELSIKPVDFKAEKCGKFSDGGVDNVPGKSVLRFLGNIFARPMVYPGSLTLINKVLAADVNRGRARLLSNHPGSKRLKLETASGVYVDAMYVPGTREDRKDILIISCEGNCSYYPCGVMETPLARGYSTLGWNQPGFSDSSHLPHTWAQEECIDVVVRYALEQLQWPEERIFLYGWSIGGYTAAWAARRYPQLGGLTLDATFDSVVNLVRCRIPSFTADFAESIVRHTYPLNVAYHASKYPGNFVVIRRNKDEMMEMKANDPSANSTTALAIHLLKSRYPTVFGSLSEEFIHRLVNQHEQPEYDPSWCTDILAAGEDTILELQLPIKDVQQLASFLFEKHVRHYDTTHCDPLPSHEDLLPIRTHE